MSRFNPSIAGAIVVFSALFLESCDPDNPTAPSAASVQACLAMFGQGIPPSVTDRADRFQGKVPEAAAFCRGGKQAVNGMNLPWVDWGNYFGTSDASRGVAVGRAPLSAPRQGVQGALLDLETSASS